MFLIGEISKLFQIDVRTLRYYDEIDLFKPAHVDERSGYRYYTIEQFEQLNTILYLKALHIPLKNVKLFLQNRNIDHILQLLEEQKQETEQRISDFVQIQKKIESRIHQIKDAANDQKMGTIREVVLPERMIVQLKQKIRHTDNLEMSIRLLENATNMKSTIFLGKVGLSISLDNLRLKRFKEYDSIFVFVEDDSYRVTGTNEQILPEATYITIRFVGTHEDAAPYYKKLMDYVEQKQYTIIDDAIEITLIDYGLTSDQSKFVTEIQIVAK
ncbi:MerR family transcriptional regulator [Brevibacillus reuszeri]|uniref:MerR family transcriptional regulator n=1 Tax=Brevibacillus reuszeri TaxID=54915 RepID=UPI003D257467